MKNKIPFGFIFDLLHLLEITIKPMFGCHAIYANGKILLAVRKKEERKDANGVWIATTKEHHESLREELPSIKSVYLLSDGKNETSWQMIHEQAIDFEEAVIKICALIKKEDKRIGKIPKVKPKKNKKKV